MYVCTVYCPSYHKPEVVDGAFQREIQCRADTEYSCESAACCVHDPSVGQPVSGILMSKYVLKEVTINGASGTLRSIHMTLAYWGFVLMSFHLGLHVRAMAAPIVKKMNKAVRVIVRILFLLIAAYGVYAFERRGIGDYLLMRVMFAFFDFSESRVRFLWDYAAVMVLAAAAGYYIQSGMLMIQKRRYKDLAK